MTAIKCLLPLSATVALLVSLGAPASAFRTAPSIAVHSRGAPMPAHARTPTLLRSSQDEGGFPSNNSQEREMMEQIQQEQAFRQIAREAEPMPASEGRVDPLIASLTRIDEPTPDNVPTVQAPLLGEIPADGNLALLVPAAAIGVLGFLFSIVVAFNSRDEIAQEMSKVEIPEMKYTPTKVVEGECRGLCSSQDKDLDGMRAFMESLAPK